MNSSTCKTIIIFISPFQIIRMSSQNSSLEDDIVLRIDVEKINQRDEVAANTISNYQPEDPRISRRIIRAVRNELIRLIQEQSDLGADVSEFEHILYRDEPKQSKRVHRIPQIRCPSKGLRALPRVDYSSRYSEKTGKPLDKSEARREEVSSQLPSKKKVKKEFKRSESLNFTTNHVQEDHTENRLNGTSTEAHREVASTENQEGEAITEDQVEEAVSFIISQTFMSLYERNGEQDPVEDSVMEDSAVSGFLTSFEEAGDLD